MLKWGLLTIFIIIFVHNAYSSAWTKKKGELTGIFEIENISSHRQTLFSRDNNSLSYYESISYKLFFEYGLVDKLTLGGYIKNYNFYSQFLYENQKLSKKLKDDYYGNLFLNQNFYNKNNKVFSLQYAFYFPIKYTKISEKLNTIDTKYSFELTTAFGKDGQINFLNLHYYLNLSASYKLVTDINYDQITLNSVFGFKINESSALNFSYEYKCYIKDNLNSNQNLYNYYNGSNSNQIKISFDYKFLDNLATEFSLQKTFSRQNSIGLTFGFLFFY